MTIAKATPTTTTSEACQPLAAIERMGGLSDLYAAIVGRFLDDSAGTYARLRAAVATNDASAVHFEAHSFKGLAAMCGAARVAEASAALEDAAQAGERDEFAALFARIDADLRDARESLAPYRLRPGAPATSSRAGG
ncbi:MAG TPA: Hpt domain-containing protein [Pirellulales bacterium]|nr:Hpt domain-containing protein [Pirellulales bacterium]